MSLILSYPLHISFEVSQVLLNTQFIFHIMTFLFSSFFSSRRTFSIGLLVLLFSVYTYQDIITYLHFILHSKYFNGNKHDALQVKVLGKWDNKGHLCPGWKISQESVLRSLSFPWTASGQPPLNWTPTLHLSAISTLTLGKDSVLPKDLQLWTRWIHQIFSIQLLHNSATAWIPWLCASANPNCKPKNDQRLLEGEYLWPPKPSLRSPFSPLLN